MRLVALVAVAPSVLASACALRHGPENPAPRDGAAPGDAPPPAVYPLSEGAAGPLVERLCLALHAYRFARRAACCAGEPGRGPRRDGEGEGERQGLCLRVLGAAERGRAVRVDATGVEQCVAAMAEQYLGCDWLGFAPLPAPPACRGVVHGLLPPGGGCRSSIECQGALHCEGLAAGDGVCRPPHGHGARCPGADDLLATLVLDDHLEQTHPWCAGHCERGRCVTPITAAGPCERSAQCAPGYHCAKQRCVAGRWARAGQPCDGDCERPARCLRGTCATAGKAGTPCAVDDECVGRCMATAEGGRCGPPCSRE